MAIEHVELNHLVRQTLHLFTRHQGCINRYLSEWVILG
eukprot:CAMPEP_0169399434 /NCGR_PEP_ID=MMETSP1017-20121227/53229_1 /TAXON_ID=342587 /ORGANISM="Karlodinium micrum, Strain CCMP2283" /LENGTH=37 /DNA_ID= /DNA_START= /DNA_END= /DNA_ORIENTATION=